MLSYLDAGTGSMIVGAVAAGAAGAGVAVRSQISRFKRKVSRSGADGADDTAGQDELAAD